LLRHTVRGARAGEVTLSASARALSARQWELRFEVQPAGSLADERQRQRLEQLIVEPLDALVGQQKQDPHLIDVAISKALAELMGGRLRLEGTGASTAWHVMVVADVPATESVGPATVQDAPGPATPLRVLLAEDSPVSRQIAVELLRRLGHDVEAVNDGRQVLQALERQVYDVALLDLQMPELDGLSVCREICRRWPRERRPRIVALSANDSAADWAQWREAGADGCLSKSLRAGDLQAALGGSSGAGPSVADSAASMPAARRDDVIGHLGALEAAGSGQAFAGHILDVFLNDADIRLSALRRGLARRDAAEIETEAHGLKGSAALVGAASVAEGCTALIGVVRHGAFDQAQTLVLELEGRVSAIRHAAGETTVRHSKPSDP